MRTILLELEYEGTRYQGWQKPQQQSQNTISGKLMTVLSRLTGEEIRLYPGCKTEPGMHACCQTAHFQTNSTHSCAQIKDMLDRYLPNDIAVMAVIEMPARFHASLNAVLKTYACNFTIGPVDHVFLRNTHLHLVTRPDLNYMLSAARTLAGKHDFHSLSFGRSKKNTIKELSPIVIREKEHLLSFHITATDFLTGMAQRIAAVILDAGLRHKTILPPEQLSDITPLPAKAFSLTAIEYPPEIKSLMAYDDSAYQTHSLPYASF